ncbi:MULTISPECIES: nuclear transport factor 2 family protein [Bacillus cereus group]|uniref:nuclear transport factor 2 family protein n=1 Tax=Bacillus cereus group TaxID=86661 RepID=UPI00065BA3E7|nr:MULTISPECIES: ester cyclase [Bacillus cereus group]KMQ00277.1 pyruvate kinase [Bacillus cereus]MBR9743058.1 pyruvate kinase [Bacillus cereus]MCU5223145.1 ester cyclase [Bacillus tropicus]MDA1644597.1 ester cyclase [Bacillus cereus group sp. TH163-1LC]MDA1795552.1 ester cyclase [Bacillus cereus group sp. BY8-1LC]
MKLEKNLIIIIISVFILGIVSTLIFQASTGNTKGQSIKSENVAPVSKDNVIEKEKNKKMVVDFYNEVFNKHNIDIIPKYVSEDYKQHNPFVADGRKAFMDFFKEDFVKNPNSSAEIKRVVAEGDTVALHVYSRTNSQDKGVAIVDIFRIKDGNIVEHWDVIQEIPNEAANNNTMF